MYPSPMQSIASRSFQAKSASAWFHRRQSRTIADKALTIKACWPVSCWEKSETSTYRKHLVMGQVESQRVSPRSSLSRELSSWNKARGTNQLDFMQLRPAAPGEGR